MGSSVAYHLAADPGFSGSILVLEKDPSYQRCASALSRPRSASNIPPPSMCRSRSMASPSCAASARIWRWRGKRPPSAARGRYLFLATPEGRGALEAGHAIQQRWGGHRFAQPAAIAGRFSLAETGDLAAGCYGRSGEGWFDGYGLMQAIRRKARSLGVTYRADGGGGASSARATG